MGRKHWIICSPFLVLTGHYPLLLLEMCGHAGSCQHIPWYVVCGGGLVHELLARLDLVDLRPPEEALSLSFDREITQRERCQ